MPNGFPINRPKIIPREIGSKALLIKSPFTITPALEKENKGTIK